MVKKFSKIGVCMVFVLSMILPQAAVSKAKTANPYTAVRIATIRTPAKSMFTAVITKTELNSMERMAVKRKSTH